MCTDKDCIQYDKCSRCDILEQRLIESQDIISDLKIGIAKANIVQDHWRIRCVRAEDRVIKLEEAIIKEMERDHGKLLSLLFNSPISRRNTD